MDVIKTRLQLHTGEFGTAGRALASARAIVAEGGLVALWTPGLVASLAREMLYSGCTKGLYPLARDTVASLGERASGGGGGGPGLADRALAAALTGTGGSFFANAVDVVKIRQFEQPARYGSLLGALGAIAREEGVVRGCCCAASRAHRRRAARRSRSARSRRTTTPRRRCASSTRSAPPRPAAPSRSRCTSSRALVTGVAATTVAAPFDTLKSRVMASGSALGVGGAARELFAREGARALFRGWLPCYFRLGPHRSWSSRCSSETGARSASTACCREARGAGALLGDRPRGRRRDRARARWAVVLVVLAHNARAGGFWAPGYLQARNLSRPPGPFPRPVIIPARAFHSESARTTR